MSALTIRPGQTVEKDPSAIKVYEFDWTNWLAASPLGSSAQISGSPVFTIGGADAVLTKDQESVVSGNLKTRVRLSAGTLGVTYMVSCKVSTNESPAQTDERSFFVRIVNK